MDMILDGKRRKLTANGVERLDRKHPGEPPCPGEVAICKAWLEQFAQPRATLNTRCTSYALKHGVENWLERRLVGQHISNGAFIKAALELGYDVGLSKGALNVHINLSEETFKAHHRWFKGVARILDDFLKNLARANLKDWRRRSKEEFLKRKKRKNPRV